MYKMVELSYLEKFTKGNITKMKRYISMYLDSAPEIFGKMERNVKDGAWSELAINAHSLKPQVEFMGINDLKELLAEIESKVKNDLLKDIENLYIKAKHLHEKSEVTLKEFLNSK